MVRYIVSIETICFQLCYYSRAGSNLLEGGERRTNTFINIRADYIKPDAQIDKGNRQIQHTIKCQENCFFDIFGSTSIIHSFIFYLNFDTVGFSLDRFNKLDFKTNVVLKVNAIFLINVYNYQRSSE